MKAEHPDQTKFLKDFKEWIFIFCQVNNLNWGLHFNLQVPIIIYGKCDFYEKHLAYYTMTFSPLKLKLFLDYQKSIYNGTVDFTKLVEHGFFNILERDSPFDNTERLKIVLDWLEENKSKIKTDVYRQYFFNWKVADKKLKDLSKKLHFNKYISKPTDFYKAITEQKKTIWLKDPETLAYLINQLYTKDFISPNIRNGYIKATNELFCAYSEKSATKFNTKLYLENFNRNPSKHSKTKRFVDNSIKELTA